MHVVALVLLVVAGACFLLAAFGTGNLGPIGLVPAGLLCTVAALAARHTAVPHVHS